MTPKAWLYLGMLALFVLAQATFGALAYDYGRKSGVKAAQRVAKQELAEYRAGAERDRQEAAKANQKLRDQLARKPAANAPGVIRANPTDCTVPRPVADELRKAVDQVNAAR